MAYTARALAELSLPPILAKEVATQLNTGVPKVSRLVELSMVPALAKELASQILTTKNANRLAALGMPTALARYIASGTGPPPVVAEIAPGPSWTGVAGSGFAVTPTPVTRTVASPALRLLVPPNQYYKDTLVVGFASGALDNGSLKNNMGLVKLTVYYEGNTIEIPSPSYKTFPDVNGVPRTYYGWWCTLTRANATNGDANLYVEAEPTNPLFQKRLEGPHQFSPYTFAATSDKYDYKIDVSPSLSVIAGVRYQTVLAANTYLVGQLAVNPLITMTEAATYDITAVAATYQPNGYFNLTASAAAIIGKATYTTDANANLRTRINGMHIFGQNVTIDFRNIGVMFRETGGTRQHWLDGMRFTDSLGRGRLWRGGTRSQVAGWCVAGTAWYTEVNMDNLQNTCVNGSLVRGGNMTVGYGDVVTDALCVVGVTCTNWSNNDYANDLPSYTVTYTGSETTATLALSGLNDAATRTFTLKYGATTQTFTVSRSEGAANYWPASVVNWINGLAVTGLSATLLNDTRRATYSSLAGLKGDSFPDTNIKSTTLTVVTMIDLHNDFWQTVTTNENAYLSDIKITEFVGAILFPTASGGLKDAIITNIASYNSPTTTGYDINVNTFSQYSQPHSHVVTANCTLSNQGLRLQATYTADPYCAVINNSMRSMQWLGTVDNDLSIKDNHLHATFTNPTNGVNTTIAGDETTLYVSAATGDFTPAGALLANLKPTALKYDMNAKARATNDAAGAVAV